MTAIPVAWRFGPPCVSVNCEKDSVSLHNRVGTDEYAAAGRVEQGADRKFRIPDAGGLPAARAGVCSGSGGVAVGLPFAFVVGDFGAVCWIGGGPGRGSVLFALPGVEYQ
jgi:hypothetical protein